MSPEVKDEYRKLKSEKEQLENHIEKIIKNSIDK